MIAPAGFGETTIGWCSAGRKREAKSEKEESPGKG
jgi:hypothetical protein